MSCFEILNIEPTKDVREIKKAYSRLLKKYHPEEHVEEFKMINEAYQQALRYAKEESIERNELTGNVNNDFYYDSKFKKIDDYEIKLEERQREIYELTQRLKYCQKKFSIPQKSFFNDPLFLKYYKDPMFISAYIHLIHDNLYRNINSIERKKLKRFHTRLYFKKGGKKKFSELYSVLEPILYKPQKIGIEMVLLVVALFFSVFPYGNTKYFGLIITIELVLITFYPTLIVYHNEPHNQKRNKLCRYALWSSLFILFVVGLVFF